MSRQSILCKSCGQSFDADSEMSRAFCLYCGAENAVTAAVSVPAADSLNLSTDPAVRKSQLEQIATSGNESASLARDRLLFWAARYEPVDRHGKRYGDKFVEFMSTLIFYSSQKNTSSFAMKRVRKDRDRFLARPALQKAMIESAHPRALLFLEFTDASRIYLSACKEDKHYGSKLFDFVRLSEKDIAVKAAADVAIGMMDFLCRLDRTTQTDLMVQALHMAYPSVFTKFPDILDEAIANLPDETRSVLYQILSTKPDQQEDTK